MGILESIFNMFDKRKASREQMQSIKPTFKELKKLGSNPSREQIKPLMERALRVLNDTELQNADYPRSLYLDYDDGPEPTPDELPKAQGEFGHSVDNPIPVNGSTGEISYLSKLVTANGQRMAFQRAGSTDSQATDKMVDIFELVSVDGVVKDTLYLDMYHLGQSKKAPQGYQLLEKLDGITGISSGMIKNFPEGLAKEVFKEAVMTFGMPVVAPALQMLRKE